MTRRLSGRVFISGNFRPPIWGRIRFRGRVRVLGSTGFSRGQLSFSTGRSPVAFSPESAATPCHIVDPAWRLLMDASQCPVYSSSGSSRPSRYLRFSTIFDIYSNATQASWEGLRASFLPRLYILSSQQTDIPSHRSDHPYEDWTVRWRRAAQWPQHPKTLNQCGPARGYTR